MKKITFLLLLLYSVNIYSQKGINQFSLIAGYEQFPENRVAKGYNIGVEFKHYLNKCFYAVANFHAGVNDGSSREKFTNNNTNYDFTLWNSVREYMLGIGIGADLMQIKKHKIYLQATVGMGHSEESKDEIVLAPHPANWYITKAFEVETTGYAVSVTAGYDYQVTKWLSLGVNYTGWKIGTEYTNSANAKIGFTF